MNEIKDEQALAEEELLKLAATQQVTQVGGRQREQDGTVFGWHKWSRSHSQREEEVVICYGREEWNQEQKSQLLSLVSWNVLSDTWWNKEKAEGEYSHTEPQQGEWSYRLSLILQWIDHLNPNILALQEIDYRKFDDLLQELAKRGYNGKMQKPKKKAEKQPCGVATFWKADKFLFVKEASFSRTQCVVLAWSCENDTQLCITNVHLESSQNQSGFDRRARQLNSALAWAATEASDATLLVCGDWNTGADAQLFQVLREYSWHGHVLSSVYEHPDTHQTLPVSHATFLVPGHHYSIDHMLYDPERLRLKCALNAFSKEEMDEHVHKNGDNCGFPSAFCPSDHIPIGAMFELLPQTAVTIKQCSVVSIPIQVSEERKAELIAQWESLQAQRPTQTKGKPTPEEIAERRVYANAIKVWKQTVEDNPTEKEFVNQLIKEHK